MSKRQTGQFLVETEDGETITVFEFTEIGTDEPSTESVIASREETKEYRTEEGRVLIRVREDIFEIVETGQRAMRTV